MTRNNYSASNSVSDSSSDSASAIDISRSPPDKNARIAVPCRGAKTSVDETDKDTAVYTVIDTNIGTGTQT